MGRLKGNDGERVIGRRWGNNQWFGGVGEKNSLKLCGFWGSVLRKNKKYLVGIRKKLYLCEKFIMKQI